MFNTRFAKSSDDEPEEQARPIKGEGLKNPQDKLYSWMWIYIPVLALWWKFYIEHLGNIFSGVKWRELSIVVFRQSVWEYMVI